jgi:hypothetical protein
LNPSDQALSRVYQNLILDGLRFEKMNDRFDDVKEAHLKTFSWILGRSDDDLENADVLELSVRWYTVVYILDVYIECLPRVS